MSPRADQSNSRPRLRRVLAPIAALALAACQEAAGPLAPSSESRLAPTGALRNLTGATTTFIFPQAAPGDNQIVGDARGLNAAGQVTGGVNRNLGGDFIPYRWSPGGVLEFIPQGSAGAWGADINDAGVITGRGVNQFLARRAFRAIGTTAVLLPTLPSGFQPGDVEAVGHAINNAGQIVGWSHTGSPGVSFEQHATLWSVADVPQDLGTLGGTTSEAFDINNAGQVIGSSRIAGDAVTHFFLWSAGGGMVDLNVTVAPTITNVVEINDAGQIIGDYTTTGGTTHAFLYTPGSGLLDLGTLGGATSTPTGLNNNGQVVGRSTLADGSMHAFLWTSTDGIEDITAVTGISEVRRLNDNLQTLAGAAARNTTPSVVSPQPRLVQLQFTPTESDAPPVAAFTWSCEGKKCSFDASSSTDDHGIVSYQWDFDRDHGRGGKTSGVTTKTTYPKGGSHQVMLTVTDTNGQTNSVTRTVVVP